MWQQHFVKEPKVASIENSPSSPLGLGQSQHIGRQRFKPNLLRKIVCERQGWAHQSVTMRQLFWACVWAEVLPGTYPWDRHFENLSLGHGMHLSAQTLWFIDPLPFFQQTIFCGLCNTFLSKHFCLPTQKGTISWSSLQLSWKSGRHL